MPQPPLPKDTTSQQLGREADAVAHRWASRNRFIYRPGDQATDFGLDAEIEPNDGGPTAELVKLQIKGKGSPVRFTRDGTYTLTSVKTTTMNYWAALPLNVVVLLVEVESDRIYYSTPVPAFGIRKPSVTFRRDWCANDDPQAFRELISRLGSRSSRALVLDQIPQVLAGYADVRAQVGLQDPGSQLDYLQEGLLERAYEHVGSLCDMFDLDQRPHPLRLWRARSEYAADMRFSGGAGDDGLLDVVAAEMMFHLEPLYFRALRAVDALADTHDLAEYHPKIASWVDSGVLKEEPLRRYFARDEHGRFDSLDSLLGTGSWIGYGRDPSLDRHLRDFESRLRAEDVDLLGLFAGY